MKKAFDGYERIAKGIFGMSSIWLGADHVLYIRGRGFLLPFSEEYKRFRYQDIRAISIAKTWGAISIGALWLVSLVIFTLIFASTFQDAPTVFDKFWSWGVAGGATVISLVFLIRNFVIGARCKCVLQTGIKSEPLIPLSRFSQATNVVARLEERVTQSQTEAADD